ncbi:MAG: cob(I)yrinic acid a,c-diamide adenosyltransferase [Deltaproteobacteria bacterium]|nr:cob(I)yrinic acid a,c-diamide adenosyltransferase [Deltaproteobacteria bacterium]
MRIYTGTGDQGYTSLFSGERVPKCHERLHAYGDLDELSSILGVLITKLPDSEQEIRNDLLQIQSNLLSMGAWLATTPDSTSECVLEEIPDSVHEALEHSIDILQEDLPLLTQFILPGGHESAAVAHVARTVCRRSERHVVAMMACLPEEEKPPQLEKFLIYLNRLSDYLFVLARHCNAVHGFSDVLWPHLQNAGKRSVAAGDRRSPSLSVVSSSCGERG